MNTTKMEPIEIKLPQDIIKVIVITEKKAKQADIIDNLLANPIKLKDFSPFLREEIYERL